MSDKAQLELISIHIPKSGGTSFRNILTSIYGDQSVARFDVLRRKQGDQVMVNNQSWEAPLLPENTRVLHGHFAYQQLADRFEIDPSIPVITWLRNPVDRVISQYFYLLEQLRKYLDDRPEALELLEKFRKNILEFAQDERNRNRITLFLQGMNLEQFHFVGLMEHYQEDLDDLGQALNWNQRLPVIHSNQTRKKRDIHDKVRDVIAELNQEDMALYRHAMALRDRRRHPQ